VKNTRARTERNDESRARADQHQQPWSENELELLLEIWDEGIPSIEDQIALAELLGRTVEACRQKLYETRKHGVTVVPDHVKTSLKRLDRWSKGFTSLEDMGF